MTGMTEDTWSYDRSSGVHHLSGGSGSTIRKAGDDYRWEGGAFSGQSPNLKAAKRAAYSAAHPPEPTRYTCMDCHREMICEMEWSGPPHYWWEQHLPGSFELIIVNLTFYTGALCEACIELREKQKERDKIRCGMCGAPADWRCLEGFEAWCATHRPTSDVLCERGKLCIIAEIE